MIRLHIGIDDTDSPNGGCTTYIAALLIERLNDLGVKFLDYPNLIRLNPNVPWKTRGNGALCLRVKCESSLIWKIEDAVLEVIEENADLMYEGTEPGVVFFFGDVPEEIEMFSEMALKGIVNMKMALDLIKKYNAEAYGFNDGRGIIGGLAAIGNLLKNDHTYEILAYRLSENRGTKRRIVASSVFEMDRKTGTQTFNNVDPDTGRILITPRGPDPVLFGIRGENPDILRQAFKMIVSEEPIERWVIFRTNQGTDAHLFRVRAIKDVKPFCPVIVRGVVSEKPKVIQGGHVIFTIKDDSGEIDCAAYEPTGTLCNVCRRLLVGDVIEAYGGVRPPSQIRPLTINLEKLKIIDLVPGIVYVNPSCPKCGKRMKSMGKNKGFRCKSCGYRGPQMKKITKIIERKIKPGLYITAPRSQRHLTKPFSRYGLEKKHGAFTIGDVIPYNELCGSR